MNPLTIKRFRVISQTQNNEVYNVIYKYCVVELYHVISSDHVGKRYHIKMTLYNLI